MEKHRFVNLMDNIIEEKKSCSNIGNSIGNALIRNASTRIFTDIMKATGIKLPKYFNNTSQLDSSYKDFAFSETTYHPKYHKEEESLDQPDQAPIQQKAAL